MKDEWMKQYLGSGEITIPWSQFELQTLRHLREPGLGQLSWVIFSKSPLAKSNIQGLSTQAISGGATDRVVAGSDKSLWLSGWHNQPWSTTVLQTNHSPTAPPWRKPCQDEHPQRSPQASCWPSRLWENQGKEIQYHKSPGFDKRVCKKIGWTKC